MHLLPERKNALGYFTASVRFQYSHCACFPAVDYGVLTFGILLSTEIKIVSEEQCWGNIETTGKFCDVIPCQPPLSGKYE